MLETDSRLDPATGSCPLLVTMLARSMIADL